MSDRKWQVTVWFSEDPDDFIEVRVSPARDAQEAITRVERLLAEVGMEVGSMSAVRA